MRKHGPPNMWPPPIDETELKRRCVLDRKRVGPMAPKNVGAGIFLFPFLPFLFFLPFLL
jgi:hypothetical protein